MPVTADFQICFFECNIANPASNTNRITLPDKPVIHCPNRLTINI